MTGADNTSALSSVGKKKALEVLMSNIEHQKALALLGTSIAPKKTLQKVRHLCLVLQRAWCWENSR